MFKLAIYQRYVMREVIIAIGLVLLALLSLFCFFNFIDELRSVGKGGYGAGHAVVFVLLGVPSLVYELVPIATLIGTLYALSNLARHSEIVVLRASGVATAALLKTLFRVALGLSLVTFLVGEGLVPVADRHAQALKAKAIDGVVAQGGFDTGIWMKDGRNFVNVAKVAEDGRLEGVRIYAFGRDNALESLTHADDASFELPDRWHLRGVVRNWIDARGVRIETRDEDTWQSAVTPNLVSVLVVSPDRMALPSLLTYTRHLIENRQKTDRYEIALWKKLFYPLATLVMVALALPFAYSHDRVGGVSLKIFAGVMIGILFYMLNGIFSNLGAINAWPPLASAVAPSLLFLLAATGMIWWSERR